MVLAHDTSYLACFEAIAIKLDSDDLVTPRWRDWPKHPLFARLRWQLARLPQEHAAA